MKMNRIIKGLILTIVSLCIPSLAFAASASISASKTSAYVGESVTITVRYQDCTWN